MPKSEPNSRSNSSQLEKNRRFSSLEFDLVVNPKSNLVKVTIAVSKKVAARAVDRNRIKRIFKEALWKTNLLDGSATFIVKKNIAGIKSSEVEWLIKKLISK